MPGTSDLNTVPSTESYVAPNAKNLPTDQLLNTRFVFYSAVLKNYIKHSHEVESMTRSEIKERVEPVMNALIEKYKFGSRFVSEINTEIARRFIQPSSQVLGDIQNDANLPSDVFDSMMTDLKGSNIFNAISSNFRVKL